MKRLEARLGTMTAIALATAAIGCTAHMRGGAKLQTNARLHGDAHAESNVDARIEVQSDSKRLGGVRIEFEQGALQYHGGVIEFAYNEAKLEGDRTEQTLQALLAFLREHPKVSVEIEGHTDSRGSDQYNLELSRRRAEAIRQWLVDHGIEEARITTSGHGERGAEEHEPEECYNQVPSDPSQCEEAWAESRRAVFRVTGGAETIEPDSDPEPREPRVRSSPPAKTTQQPTEPCAWYGLRAGLLGPASYVHAEGVVRPACWVELSLGVGHEWGDLRASTASALWELKANGKYVGWSVPVKARFWMMPHGHGIVGELGLGYVWYDGKASSSSVLDDEMTYQRTGGSIFGAMGLGYGYRSSGHWEIALLAGLSKTAGKLPGFDGTVDPGYPRDAADDLATSLDSEMDALTKVRPFGEASFGWMF